MPYLETPEQAWLSYWRYIRAQLDKRWLWNGERPYRIRPTCRNWSRDRDWVRRVLDRRGGTAGRKREN